MSDIDLDSYYEALGVKTPEEILKDWERTSPPRKFGDNSEEIQYNGYVRNQLAEKLVALYLKDLGSILKKTYIAQKKSHVALVQRFEEEVFNTCPFHSDVTPSDALLCDRIRDAAKPKLQCYPGRSEWKKWKNAIECINLKKTILFCVDLEAYERDTNIVTEIGITIYDPRENFDHSVLPLTRSFHFCIEEAYDLRNGRFVDDAKDNFIFDDSQILPLDEVVELVQNLIDKYLIPHNRAEHSWKRALVGHGISGDISWLESLDIRLPNNVQTLDTQKLFENMYGRQSSLKRLLNLCRIPHSYLHNAGNDSYYTLQLLLSMCDIGTRIKLDLDNWHHVRRLEENLYCVEQLEKQGKRKRNRGNNFSQR